MLLFWALKKVHRHKDKTKRWRWFQNGKTLHVVAEKYHSLYMIGHKKKGNVKMSFRVDEKTAKSYLTLINWGPFYKLQNLKLMLAFCWLLTNCIFLDIPTSYVSLFLVLNIRVPLIDSLLLFLQLGGSLAGVIRLLNSQTSDSLLGAETATLFLGRSSQVALGWNQT